MRSQPETAGRDVIDVHFDGYPTGVGATLLQLVARDGVDTVRQRILHDRYGWSNLNPEGGALSELYHDGRFVIEPGYGTAYTTHQGQSAPNEWIEAESGDDWGTEWAYVLGDTHLFIFERRFAPDDPKFANQHAMGFFGISSNKVGKAVWVPRGTVAYTEAPSTAVEFLTRIEHEEVAV